MKGRERRVDVFFFLLAAICLGVGFGLPRFKLLPLEPGIREEGTLRVVTWNVGGSSGEFGRALRDEDLDHIANVIAALDPDLCLLQEVRSTLQMARLQSSLGRHWTFRISRGSDSGNRRVAALAQNGTLKAFRLSKDSAGALGVIYRTKGKPAIATACVHADAYSSQERNLLLGAVAEELHERRDTAIKILAGDLNLDLDLDKRRDLFTDDEYRDVETYNFLARNLEDAGSGTGSTAEPDRRLDYIFFSPETLELVEAGPWKGKRIDDMDHDPVLADLSYRNP